MKEMLCECCKQRIANYNISTIEKIVCKTMQIPEKLIFQKDRRSNVVICRAIIWKFARKTGWNLTLLAHRYNMHHTSIISALKMLENLIDTEDGIRNTVNSINDTLLNLPPNSN